MATSRISLIAGHFWNVTPPDKRGFTALNIISEPVKSIFYGPQQTLEGNKAKRPRPHLCFQLEHAESHC